MPARLVVVTAPAREPVTLDEVVTFARIDTGNTNEDPLLADLIAAARRRCEQHQASAYITQTWDLMLDAFPTLHESPDAFSPYNLIDAAITIPLHPVQSITSVTYTLSDGTPTVLPAGDYVLDAASIPARLVPQVGTFWPRDLLQAVNGIAVRFVAGYGANESDVPAHLRLAIKQLVTFWYTNRDAMPDIPAEIDALLSEATGGFAYA